MERQCTCEKLFEIYVSAGDSNIPFCDLSPIPISCNNIFDPTSCWTIVLWDLLEMKNRWRTLKTLDTVENKPRGRPEEERITLLDHKLKHTHLRGLLLAGAESSFCHRSRFFNPSQAHRERQGAYPRTVISEMQTRTKTLEAKRSEADSGQDVEVAHSTRDPCGERHLHFLQ